MIKETSTATLELIEDNIVLVKIKEHSEIGVDEMKEQIAAREELINDRPFGIIVDLRVFHSVTNEGRKYAAAYTNPNWKAMAIIFNNLATKLTVDFYNMINKPLTPTKAVTSQEYGAKWLKEQLKKEKISQ